MNCLLGVLSKRGANIGPEKGNHLTVGYVHLSVAPAPARIVGELQPTNLNIDRLLDPTVAPQWATYFAKQMADTLSNAPENIDNHCAIR